MSDKVPSLTNHTLEELEDLLDSMHDNDCVPRATKESIVKSMVVLKLNELSKQEAGLKNTQLDALLSKLAGLSDSGSEQIRKMARDDAREANLLGIRNGDLHIIYNPIIDSGVPSRYLVAEGHATAGHFAFGPEFRTDEPVGHRCHFRFIEVQPGLYRIRSEILSETANHFGQGPYLEWSSRGNNRLQLAGFGLATDNTIWRVSLQTGYVISIPDRPMMRLIPYYLGNQYTLAIGQPRLFEDEFHIERVHR